MPGRWVASRAAKSPPGLGERLPRGAVEPGNSPPPAVREDDRRPCPRAHPARGSARPFRLWVVNNAVEVELCDSPGCTVGARRARLIMPVSRAASSDTLPNMATSEQIKALIDSHAKRDDSRFRAVAMQIAATSAKQGKTKLAEEVRALLDEARLKRDVHVAPAIPIARPPGELAALLVASYPQVTLANMVLTAELRSELEGVVTEYRQRDRLLHHGLSPKQRLLLVGPPGCGKTMTASALAGECHLPLMVVQLHSLITKFMGETAAKLHLVFEAIQKTPGVYLFDEFDAIGAVRSTPGDVGEIRRVLNSFLQFIEQSASDSMIVASTNIMPLLDEALFRRFDAVLRYSLPTAETIRTLIENRLSQFKLGRITWKRIAAEGEGLSHADIVRAAEAAAKQAVLRDQPIIRTLDLVGALQKRKMSRPAAPVASDREDD
jgi:SpoVK/Ycf46/Vps4 family AAA+-type ATPase